MRYFKPDTKNVVICRFELLSGSDGPGTDINPPTVGKAKESLDDIDNEDEEDDSYNMNVWEN